MRSDSIAFLLDEHYPLRLAEQLRSAGVDAVTLVGERPELVGVDDSAVLRAAASERRVVVTEDVSTFGVAGAQVPDHVGIVFCHYARFPRTANGLTTLRTALVSLAADPPAGLGDHPVVWWLAPGETDD